MFNFIQPAILVAAMAFSPLLHAADVYPAGKVTVQEFMKERMGSFAQFTPNVAVTVRHNNVGGFYTLPCADIEFFKHRGTPLQWEAVPTDNVRVVASGYAYNSRFEAEHGLIGGDLLPLDQMRICENRYYLMFHTAQTEPGFSGGPVFNERTGKAIGITKGAVEAGQPMAGKGVFIPFEVILHAWRAAVKDGKIPAEFADE